MITSSSRTLLAPAALMLALAPIARANDSLFERLDRDGDGRIVANEVSSEHQRLLARLLRTADKNGDAQLDRAEFSAALQPRRPEKPLEELQENRLPGADELEVLLAKLDVNRDGRITPQEVPEELGKAFGALVERGDRNSDGQLNRAEINRGGAQLARIAQREARQLKIDVPKELASLRRAAQRGQATPLLSEKPPQPAELLADKDTAAEIFRRLDEDSDGKLSAQEIPKDRKQLVQMLRRADRDGDGSLSQPEFTVAAERIAKLMANQKRPSGATPPKSTPPKKPQANGKNTQKANPSQSTQFATMLRRLDRNQDGKLSPDELPKRLAKRARSIDANRDGTIDRQELRRALAAMNRKK